MLIKSLRRIKESGSRIFPDRWKLRRQKPGGRMPIACLCDASVILFRAKIFVSFLFGEFRMKNSFQTVFFFFNFMNLKKVFQPSVFSPLTSCWDFKGWQLHMHIILSCKQHFFVPHELPPKKPSASRYVICAPQSQFTWYLTWQGLSRVFCRIYFELELLSVIWYFICLANDLGVGQGNSNPPPPFFLRKKA